MYVVVSCEFFLKDADFTFRTRKILFKSTNKTSGKSTRCLMNNLGGVGGGVGGGGGGGN